MQSSKIETDNIDNTPPDYVCDICQKVFINKIIWKKHKEKHLEEVAEDGAQQYFIICKHCKIPFVEEAALNEHIEEDHKTVSNTNSHPTSGTGHGKKSKRYQCNLCRKTFETSGALCSHQGWHKRVNYEHRLAYKTKNRAYFYPPPNNSAPKSSQVLQQQLLQKQQQQPVNKFKCQTCLQSFVNDTALQIHILEAHRNINATLVNPHCNMCEIDFESQSQYEKHMELHKIVEKQTQKQPQTYQCKYCAMKFNRNDLLEIHVKTQHRQFLLHPPKMYKCNLCDKAFEKMASLHMHRRIHNRIGPSSGPVAPPISQQTQQQQPQQKTYSCSICYAKFTVPKELRNHIIAAHLHKK